MHSTLFYVTKKQIDCIHARITGKSLSFIVDEIEYLTEQDFFCKSTIVLI